MAALVAISGYFLTNLEQIEQDFAIYGHSTRIKTLYFPTVLTSKIPGQNSENYYRKVAAGGAMMALDTSRAGLCGT